MGPFKRSDRVAGVLRDNIAAIIQNELKNPEIGFVTVTSVQLSRDLRSARVYVTILGSDEDKDQTLEILKNSIASIKNRLRKRVSLKYMPELQFRYDPSLDQGERIDEILDSLNQDNKDEER